jgi:hypothetical protein
VRSDIETAVWIGANVVSVVFAPGASTLAIDSVSRAVDLMQRDSIVLIAVIGYHGKLLPELSSVPMGVDERLATVRRVLTRLRPDVIVPAEDPYGVGARILGRLPVETWRDYYTQAAAVVKEVRPRTRVGLSAAAFDSRDSALYAWAAGAGSPVDIVGFSFYPSRLGARTLDASFRAADRWMRAHPPTKLHWVFGAGGYPLAHGEKSQDRAIWASLTWATAHYEIRGLVVNEANDYAQAMGVRAPNGQFRRSAFTLRKSIKALRESAVQPEPALAPAR